MIKLTVASEEKQTRNYFLKENPSSDDPNTDGGYSLITDFIEDNFKDTIKNSPSIVTFQIYCKTIEKVIIKYHFSRFSVVKQEFVQQMNRF